MIFTLILFFLFLSFKLYANPACGVCTVAVFAGLTIAKKLGIDESVVGLWSGAMLSLIGYWFILYFDKKKWNFLWRDQLLMILSISTIGFIYIKKVPYTPEIVLYFLYIDKILFSTILGALLFIYIEKLYQWMKKRNNGHAHFPFEKVVLPVVLLIIFSIWFQKIKFYNSL